MTHPATQNWRLLHQNNRYFETHRHYQGDKRLSTGGMEAVRKYLPEVGQNTTILDLGCGYGRLMWHLMDVAGEVWGYDIAEQPLGRAAALLSQKGLNWRLFLGNGQDLQPLVNESVDAVVSLCVFQHLPRGTAISLIADLPRVLKPGGRAAIQFLGGPSQKDIDLSNPKEQSIQYSVAQIRDLAAGTRLEIEQVDHQNIGMNPLCYRWLVVRKN